MQLDNYNHLRSIKLRNTYSLKLNILEALNVTLRGELNWLTFVNFSSGLLGPLNCDSVLGTEKKITY